MKLNGHKAVVRAKVLAVEEEAAREFIAMAFRCEGMPRSWLRMAMRHCG
jgi:hypothetical protein